MPHSAVDNKQSGSSDEQPGQNLAVTAEVLYLLNLLLLPGIAFILLLIIYVRYRKDAAPLAACHLSQTLSASIWAGVMLVLVNGLIILLGGYEAPSTWVVAILYFTTIHATFILLGSLGLARAMAGQHFHYLLVGRDCPEKSR